MQMIHSHRRFYLRSHRERKIRIDARDPDLVRSDADRQNLLVAELLADHHRAVEPDLIVGRCAEADILRAHAEADGLSGAWSKFAEPRRWKLQAHISSGENERAVVRGHIDIDEIHGR